MTITSTKTLKNIKIKFEMHATYSKTIFNIFTTILTKLFEINNFYEKRRRRVETITNARISIKLTSLREKFSLII